MNAKNWQAHLNDALNTQDPEEMQKALAHVPKQHLQLTVQAIKDQAHGLYRQGKYGEALDAYIQVLSLGTKDYFVLFHRADCLNQLERLEEAHQAAAELAELHGEYHRVHRLLGDICLKRKDPGSALAAYKQALALDKNDAKLAARVAELEKDLKEKQDVLNRVFNPEEAPEAPELPPLPDTVFDPAAFHGDMPTDVPENMRKGLATFLQNFADLEAPRALIGRIEDTVWTQAWCDLAADMKGRRVAVWGPEAGLLPLAAVDGGAQGVVAWDPYSLTRRLTEGTVQKTLVGRLQEKHGDAWTEMDKDARTALFETEAAPYVLLPEAPDAVEKDVPTCDALLVTQLDHTLLGAGFAHAVTAFKKKICGQDVAVYPAAARLFAAAVQWTYRCGDADLSGMDAFHWSPYPLQVTEESGSYRFLTEPTVVAELDMAHLDARRLDLALPVTADGTVHGVLFWYETTLGATTLNTGPDGNARRQGQAYQYLDNRDVAAGDTLALTLHLEPDRVLFQSVPPLAEPRRGALPLWHIHGAPDGPFQQAYAAAVADAVTAHGAKTVLNIGAGNGLVALAAAGAGATVYACEQSSLLCEALRTSAAAAGLADKLVLIEEDCRKLVVGEHLPEKVDMIVFDKFDCGLLGDGILHYLAHARAELAVPDAPVLPRVGHLKACLLERRIARVCGYDLTLLTPYLFNPEYTHVHLGKTPHRLLCAPFDLFSFDFAQAGPEEAEQSLEVPVSADGIVGAVVFWYTLDLGEGRTLSTAWDADGAARGQALQYLPELHLHAGETLKMKVKHTGSNVMFGIDPEGIDKERILQLPRFDPNWLNGHRNIMHQSGQIMQQLRANPEEYLRAFQLATRFAVHPQKYGLSPSVAARYLFTFLMN